MRRRIGWPCLTAIVFALGAKATIAAPEQAVAERTAVGFEQIADRTVLDSTRKPCARLVGAAKLSAEAKHGRAALDLGGPEAKGVADFGKDFALNKQGTIELWCKPRKFSGVFVGKYGAINIEFVKAEKCVRFGLKLKKGAKGTWVSCQSPKRSVKANQWANIKASWGKQGLLLFLDGKLAGRTALPATFDWFSEKGRFVLGSYTWPPSYAVWFFDGLMDDFSFQPTQELPPAGAKPAKSPSGSGTRSVVLKLLLKKTPRPNYGVPVPEKISGRVVLHTKGKAAGVQGVSVTDGYSVVKTDADGAYTLTPHAKAVFVYITRPSGYSVVAEWYKPLAAEVDFALERAARSENEYTFVHVTDTHVSTNPRSVEGLSRFVREVNALAPVLRFVLNSGDLVNLSKTLSDSPATGHAYFRNYVGIMNHLAMPYYNVAGDHTDSSYRLEEFPRGDPRCGKPLFWEYLGPNLFSFEFGRIHFMSVDYVHHLGKRQIQGREYPTNKVMPVQTAWMQQDMANRTPGSSVVTAAESDLGKFCPGFVEMAKEHDVRLQLTGDDHIVSYKDRFVPYRTAGALSGCWWNPKCRQLCPDLSPQGYLVYRVRGEEMECFYKGLGQRVAIVSHRVGAPWKGGVVIRAHLVQPQPNEVLQYTLNGKDWKEMREIGQPFYRALYETTVDSTSLTDGFVDIKVRSSLSGEVRSRKFVVVNGSAPVAFEADAALTFSVGRVSQVPRAPAGKVDVLFNDKVVGVLATRARKKYSFRISASSLKKANTLRFRFVETDDGMSLSSPVLTFQDKPLYDPRDAAVRQLRIAHWGAKAADWGGFITGDGGLNEGPFHRRQNVFCFVLSGSDTKEAIENQ